MRRGGAVLLAALASVLAATAAAQVGGAAGAKVHPRTSDILYIECQVCELLAKNAWRQVRELMKSASPTNKVDEMRVIELIEKITTAWRPEGEWIARLDLVEEGDRLAVKEMEQLGTCGVECKTVERAAERIMGEHDTDVAEALFAGKKNRAQFYNWLCYELTGVCKSKPPSLPKDRAPGPAFQPRQEGEQDLDAMLGQMQDQGLRGSLYSREDLMAKYGMPGAEDDADDADEEEAGGQAGAAGWEGSPPRPGTAPVEQLLQQAKGAARDAAAAASRGLKAAAATAQGLWGRLQGGKAQKQEL